MLQYVIFLITMSPLGKKLVTPVTMVVVDIPGDGLGIELEIIPTTITAMTRMMITSLLLFILVGSTNSASRVLIRSSAEYRAGMYLTFVA